MISKLISTVILIFVAMDPFASKAIAYSNKKLTRLSPGRLNISVYIFHDRNRNGTYDVGDVPMSGVLTELRDSNKLIATATSNKNGYANYKMSLGNSKYPINKDKEIYAFKVIKPPGWQLTAGRSLQKVRFLKKVGSPSGLIAEKAPHWVGMAPNLSLSGQVLGPRKNDPPKDISLTAIGPDGNHMRLRLNKEGKFSFRVQAGMWSLIFKSKSLDWQLIRKIQVAHSPIELIPIVAGQKQLPLQAQLIFENFDWLKRSDLEKIPNGHLNLNWDYLIAVNTQYYGGPGYVNVLNSGHAVAYNSSGHPVTISAQKGEIFDFIGGYFTVAWGKANGEILELEAFRGDVKVAHHEIELSHLGPTWIDADLRSIDKLVLSTRHYWQFVAEDLQFRIPDSNKE